MPRPITKMDVVSDNNIDINKFKITPIILVLAQQYETLQINLESQIPNS